MSKTLPQDRSLGLSGRFVGDGLHCFPVRVYYEDTDAGGIVYHANYLRFMERARTEMLRLLGLDHTGLMATEGVSFAVRGLRIDFVSPARLDDALEVLSQITDIGGASLVIEQTVRRGGWESADGRASDSRDVARASLALAMINRAGRPARLPAPVREALNQLHLKHKRD
jgi:acyl-CoA thioester hydrolase